MKTVIIAVVAVIAIIGGAMLLSNSKEETTSTGAVASNNIYGTSSTGVSVVAFEDFQCPSCAGFYPIVSQVKEIYKDQVSFQFKHFPLVQIHPNATAAHRAAEAAAKQGKFWEMHDLLFGNQSSWSSSTNAADIFGTYAVQLGLDIDKYNTDVADSGTLATINKDVEEGKTKNVSGTPTFIIDGKVIEDLTTIDTVEEFSKLLDEAIAAKTGQPAPTTEPTTLPEEPSAE